MILPINIGKGESKNLVFKITDKSRAFSETDKLLFALRRKDYDKDVSFVYEKTIADLQLESDVYQFIVPLKSEDTINLALGAYLFDVTLIDENNQKKPLTCPAELNIYLSVGASIRGGN